MKIKSIILVLLILTLSCSILASCGTGSNIMPSTTHELTTEPITETEIKTEIKTPEPSFVFPDDQIIFPLNTSDSFLGYYNEDYKNRRDDKTIGGLLTINNLCPPRQVIEPDVPKNITYKLGDTEYKLEYLWSAPYMRGVYISDVYVDFYRPEGASDIRDGYVAFKHKTNNVVTWAVDLSSGDNGKIEFATCEEYIEFFSTILGSDIDLSKYELKCTTLYRPLGGNSERIDGFDGRASREDEYKMLVFDFVYKSNELDTGNTVYIEIGSGRKNRLFVNNETSNYDYAECFNIKQSEIDYACELTENWAESNDMVPDDLEFTSIKNLYNKTYIVLKFETIKSDSGEYYVFIDYQRLQQKMALEGVKP